MSRSGSLEINLVDDGIQEENVYNLKLLSLQVYITFYL